MVRTANFVSANGASGSTGKKLLLERFLEQRSLRLRALPAKHLAEHFPNATETCLMTGLQSSKRQ